MGIVLRKVWKCDECGHQWIQAGEGKPARCPKRGCRSSRWDREIGEAIREAEGKAIEPVKNKVATPVGPPQPRQPEKKAAAGGEDSDIDPNFDWGA